MWNKKNLNVVSFRTFFLQAKKVVAQNKHLGWQHNCTDYYVVVYRNSYKNIKKDLFYYICLFVCGVGGGVIISPSLVRVKRIFTETISQAIFTFKCFTFLYSVCINQNKHWIFLTYCVCSIYLYFLNRLMENDRLKFNLFGFF